MFTLGQATITRVGETFGATYPLRDIFPDFSDAHMAEHGHWLAPHHYDAQSGAIKLSVHSLTVSQISAPRRCCDWSIATWTSRQASDERADQPSTHGCD